MGTELYIYPQYKSVWREIDNDDLPRLATSPSLQERLNEKDREVTPLYLAVMRKNYYIVEFLLQNGADPNIECKQTTPLYLACVYAEAEMVQVLLEYGADPNVLCTNRKIAPIHLAAAKGTMDILDYLVMHGANVSLHSSFYGTALHVATMKNHQNVARYLLAHGIDVNSLNLEGETCVHIAARLGNNEILKMLLEKNANCILKDNDGNTSLHLACMFSKDTPALLLIDKHPDLIYIRNNERQTPIFYASDTIRKQIKRAFSTKMPGYSASVNSKEFSDIKFMIQNKAYYAHRIVLQYRCPSLLSSQNTVTLTDVDGQVFLAFLHYLYTDTVVCDKNLLDKLGSYAEKNHVIRLKKLCLDLTTNYVVEVPPSTFQVDMKNAFNSTLHSDVTFMIQGKPIHSHRCILFQVLETKFSTLSQHEYFRAMFSRSLKESKEKEIQIIDTPFEVFQLLISYCYTFEMKDIEPDIVIELFLATNQYMIDGLKHGCESFLCTCISKDTVCQLFQLADALKSLFLREECFDYLVYHFKTLKEAEEFTSMPSELRNEISEYIERKTLLQEKKLPVPKKEKYALY